MTLTAVSVLRIRRPRAFHVLAAAVLLLGSCGSGEGESPPDEAAVPIEHAEGGGAVAEVPVDGESAGEATAEEGAAEDRPAALAAPAPAAPGGASDPTSGLAADRPETNGHAAPAPVVVAAVAPSPPPRPSPVADAPPPPPPEEPPLSPEEAIERASRPPVGDEVRSLVACGDVAEAYRGLVEENRSCTRDEDCQVIEGSCAIGLGGCWYAVNRSVGYDDTDQLAARYRELACGGPVCRCAAPPERAVCDEGSCTAR